MEKKLTAELLEKAKQAKTPEELIALAKENNTELTAEEANTYFAQLNPKSGELSDDELDQVAGGRKCGTIYKDGRPVISALNSCEHWRCEKCHRPVIDNSVGYCYCRTVNYCTNCESSRTEGGLLLCYNPKRYDN